MLIPQSQFSPRDWKTNVRGARIFHFLILAAALLLLYVFYFLTNQRTAPKPMDTMLTYVLVFVGIADFAIVLAVRAFYSRKWAPLLQANPMDPTGQAQRRTANIMSSAFANGIFMFGWVLGFIGGMNWAVILLWSLAAVSFFLFFPQSPIDESSQANQPPAMQN